MGNAGGPFDDWANRPSAQVSSALAGSLGIAVYVAEPGPLGSWLHVSPGIQEILGVPPEALLAEHDLWGSLIHPDDRDAIIGTETALGLDTRARVEYRVIRPDGRVVWLLDEAVVGAGPDGRPLMDGYLVDVSTRRRAEQMVAAHATVVDRSAGRAPLDEVLGGLPEVVVAATSACACVVELEAGGRLVAVRSDVAEVPADGAVLEALASGQGAAEPSREEEPDVVAGRVVLHYAPGVTPPPADAEVPTWAAGLVGLAATRHAERARADLMYAQLAATLESTVDGIVVLDRAGHVIGHNSRFREMWGVDARDLEAGDDAAVLDAVLERVRDPAAFVDVVRRLGGSEDTTADELRTVDGRVLERSSRALWIDGRPAGRVWSFRDVTETRRLQAELREREASLDRLVGQVRDYVIVNLSPDGRVASWNEGAARIIRYAEDEILGRPVSLLFPEDTADAIRPGRLVQDALTEGRSQEEGWCVRRSGQRFWGSAVLTALHDDDGRLRGFGLVLQDISERRAAQLALERRARTLAAVGTIATAANSADSVGAALDTALVAVCEHGGWQLAHVYLVDDDTGELRHDAWHLGADVERERFAGFVTATEASPPSTLPLPAAVLARVRTVWVTDLAAGGGSERALAGRRSGLVAATGVPVLVGDEPVGVLEFFGTGDHPFDAEADLVLRQLGTQLGRVVERQRSERRLAELARSTARSAGAAPVPDTRA